MEMKKPMPFMQDGNKTYDSVFYYGTQKYPYVHSHDGYWEFVIVTDGEYNHYCNGDMFTQKKNEIFILRPDDKHYVSAKTKDSRYLNLCVSNELVHNFFNLFSGDFYNALLKKDLIRFELSAMLVKLLQKITDDYFVSSKNDFGLTSHSIFLAISTELLAYITKEPIAQYSSGVEAFLNLFSDNENLSLPLKELIAKTNYSYSRMNAIFKKETGISPSDYFKTKKLEYAQKMLKHSTAKSAEISYNIGFATPARFCVFFKRQTGLTPSQYAKQFKNIHNFR